MDEFFHRTARKRSLLYRLPTGNNVLYLFDDGWQEKSDGAPTRQGPTVT